jgi:transcription-repair coupling factor (superfamily II helicase)
LNASYTVEAPPKQAEGRIPEAFSRISAVVEFRRIASETLRGEADVVVSGLTGTARALFVAGLWHSLRRPLILVTSQDKNVATLTSDIEYFHRVLNSAGADVSARVPHSKQIRTREWRPCRALQTRATTLWSLRQKRSDIVVTSVQAVASRLPFATNV